MILRVPEIFLSAGSVDEAELNTLNYPIELLNSIAGTTSLPDNALTLKKKYVVFLFHNLQPRNGYVISSRCIVD